MATLFEDERSEDETKRKLQSWLEADGCTTKVVWGRHHGVDIDAQRGGSRWIIEVKGQKAEDLDYQTGLGQILEQMSDSRTKYSIALPDMPKYRRLWGRLPELAKSRTQISALFVSERGTVEELSYRPQSDRSTMGEG